MQHHAPKKSTCRGLLQSCILVSSAHRTFPFQVWAHPRCARAGDRRERSVWLWVWLIAWCIDEAWVFPRLPFLRSAPADDATREAGLFLPQWEQCQTFPKFISMSNSTSLGELELHRLPWSQTQTNYSSAIEESPRPCLLQSRRCLRCARLVWRYCIVNTIQFNTALRMTIYIHWYKSYVFIYLFICLFVYLFVYLSIYLLYIYLLISSIIYLARIDSTPNAPMYQVKRRFTLYAVWSWEIVREWVEPLLWFALVG